jgi:hypothetical protein
MDFQLTKFQLTIPNSLNMPSRDIHDQIICILQNRAQRVQTSLNQARVKVGDMNGDRTDPWSRPLKPVRINATS